MLKRFNQFKPGVGRQVHLVCAAGLWSGIGTFLVLRGIILLKSGGGLWLILAGLAFGTVKSLFILDQSARKGIERIRHFDDNTCIGAVYSWQTWLLVVGMMLMGLILRHFALSPLLVGTICVAIGWALVCSSRFAWLAWMGRDF